jgi:hypothetical protein
MIATGAAAVMGGTLRILAIFTAQAFTPQTLAYFYCLIDIFLLLGLVGWYVSRAGKLGGAGLLGFVAATTGILVIRTAGLFGGYSYTLGSALLVAGLAVMNARTLLRRDGPLLAPVQWLASLTCGIASFALGPHAGPLAGLAAIVLFGSGFVAAGGELLRIRAQT